jgi:hypothetical protein
MVIVALLSFSIVALLPKRNRLDVCFSAMKNLNTSLNLYRADYDGRSPEVSRPNYGVAEQKLRDYSPGKEIFCEFNPGAFKGIFCLRLIGGRNGKKTSALLDGDTSVMAVCAGHKNDKLSVTWNRLSPTITRPIDRSNPGTITVLLRNGTVKSISPNGPRQTWYSINGVMKVEDYLAKTGPTGYMFMLYEFEPKPPQFER